MNWHTDIPAKWLIVAACILAALGGGLGYLVAGKKLGISNDTDVHVRALAPASQAGGEKTCIQAETRARNPQTHEMKTFSTPCAVPGSWEIVN